MEKEVERLREIDALLENGIEDPDQLGTLQELKKELASIKKSEKIDVNSEDFRLLLNLQEIVKDLIKFGKLIEEVE